MKYASILRSAFHVSVCSMDNCAAQIVEANMGIGFPRNTTFIVFKKAI